MHENLVIRPFDPKEDVKNSFQCFKEGFFHSLWPFFEHANLDFNLDIIRLFCKMCRNSFAAEIDGEIQAFLLGAAPTRIKDLLKAIWFFISHLLPRLLINSYKMNAIAYKHLIQMLYGFSPFVFLHPMTWPYAEIMLFTSLRSCRNRGIGRRLMDTFLNEAKKGDIKNAYVGTDTSLSYYFYDSYGFAKAKEFKMKAYKYSLPEETHRGLIYHISCKD